jgi:allophanate hydrolase subunit 1
MLSTVALGWMAGFSCAGKLEQVTAAMMIPRRSEQRFISARSGAF